jgi:Myb/SANT-like DNA-binding protein
MTKVKNQWTDIKEKWKHWCPLADMSGFGWNEEKELYEAFD